MVPSKFSGKRVLGLLAHMEKWEMPVAQASGSSQLEDLEPGSYELTCAEVTELTLEKPDSYGKTEKYAFKFRIEGVDLEEGPTMIGKRINRVFTPKSTFWKWSEVLLGRAIKVGENVELVDLIGQSCMGLITESPRDDGGTWKNISDIYPLPKKGQNGKVAEKEAPSVINPDGTPSWTAFWAEIKRLGVTREGVAAHVGGDLEVLMAMDGPDVAVVLEEIRAKVG